MGLSAMRLLESYLFVRLGTIAPDGSLDFTHEYFLDATFERNLLVMSEESILLDGFVETFQV